ncbi:MAG: lytic transglycosylase domain-containing protein [Candidatus Riflebacteria bacterium]|nr:lytic transglycosylase domain-containing protein [Candidatus Riflebacteria bacterium]
MLLLSCNLLAQSVGGGLFEVNTAASDAKASVIATSSAGTNKNSVGDAESQKVRSGLLAAIVDFLTAISDGLVSTASADTGVDSSANILANAQQQAKILGLATNGSVASVTKTIERKTAELKAKIPQLVKHKSIGGKGISAGSEKFKTWFNDAAKYSKDWKFPDVTNKYGQKISREDYLRAIIWIESRGVHQSSSGKMTKSWAGAIGFMQLMPNTARGLKVNASDAAQNLKGGAKYLGEIFNSGSVSKKDGAEKLIMGACAYNLGPFSKSMKMTWDQLKTAKIPVETRSYGLKMKMALGLELSASEKTLADKWFVPKGQTVDEFTDEFYASAQGIAR